MIKVHKTYCTVTPESAESGDYKDSGSLGEESLTFRELVDIMREYPFPSNSPIGENGAITWLSTEPSISDYSTGETIEESIHFSGSNSISKAKYWVKALKLAGYR